MAQNEWFNYSLNKMILQFSKLFIDLKFNSWSISKQNVKVHFPPYHCFYMTVAPSFLCVSPTVFVHHTPEVIICFSF